MLTFHLSFTFAFILCPGKYIKILLLFFLLQYPQILGLIKLVIWNIPQEMFLFLYIFSEFLNLSTMGFFFLLTLIFKEIFNYV